VKSQILKNPAVATHISLIRYWSQCTWCIHCIWPFWVY